MKRTPQAIANLELAQIPKGDPGSALNAYRAIYAMTRQKGLGKNREDVPATREFAHREGLRAARSIDPTFDFSMPNGDTD